MMKLLFLVPFLVCLYGCNSDTKITAYGRSWAPQLAEVKHLEYTPEQKATLQKWINEDPVLCRMIINNGAAMRAVHDQYNRWAKENNRKCLESIGAPLDEINRILGDNAKAGTEGH